MFKILLSCNICIYGEKRNRNVWCGVQDMPHKTHQMLPEELWLEVFTHLEPTDLSRAAQVCRHWSHLIGQSETLWKAQCLSVTNSETKQRMLKDKAGDEKCWRVSHVCVLNNVVLPIVTLVVHVSNPYRPKIHWLSVSCLQTKDPIHWLSVNYLQRSTGCLSTAYKDPLVVCQLSTDQRSNPLVVCQLPTYKDPLVVCQLPTDQRSNPLVNYLQRSTGCLSTAYKDPLVVCQLPTDQRSTGCLSTAYKDPLVVCQLPTDQRSTGCLSTTYRPKIHWLSLNCLQTKDPLVVCQLPTDQRSTGCLSTAYRPKIHWLSVNCLQTKEPLVVCQLPTDQRSDPLVVCQLPTKIHWLSVNCLQRSTGCLSTTYKDPLVVCQLPTDQRASSGGQDQRA